MTRRDPDAALPRSAAGQRERWAPKRPAPRTQSPKPKAQSVRYRTPAAAASVLTASSSWITWSNRSNALAPTFWSAPVAIR